MDTFIVLLAASHRISEIYQYTLNNFGQKQAIKYIEGLFNSFSNIKNKKQLSRPIPAEFEVEGFYYQYQQHFVYWKYLKSGKIGITTVLHQKMHQIKQFRDY